MPIVQTTRAQVAAAIREALGRNAPRESNRCVRWARIRSKD